MVTEAQTELRRRGYAISAITGSVNTETVAAVREYQSDAHLSVDGAISDGLLQQLRSASVEDDQKWSDLFDTYGTHFLFTGVMGGFTLFLSEIDKSLLDTMTDVQITTTLKNSYTEATGTKASNSLTAFNSELAKTKNVNDSTNTVVRTRGGTPQSNTDAFASAVYMNPVLLMGMPQEVHA